MTLDNWLTVALMTVVTLTFPLVWLLYAGDPHTEAREGACDE